MLENILRLKAVVAGNKPKRSTVLINGALFETVDYIINSWVSKKNSRVKIYLDKSFIKILLKISYTENDKEYLSNFIFKDNSSFDAGDSFKISDLDNIEIVK